LVAVVVVLFITTIHILLVLVVQVEAEKVLVEIQQGQRPKTVVLTLVAEVVEQTHQQLLVLLEMVEMGL
jgi:hypothetical protein